MSLGTLRPKRLLPRFGISSPTSDGGLGATSNSKSGGPLRAPIAPERPHRSFWNWKPDVVLARNTISVEKLLELRAELPIVFVSVFDPFGSGFVTEVARPGKNITGFTTHDYGMAVKWIEFLKLVAPGITSVALMFNPETAPFAQAFYDNLFSKAAKQIGVQPRLAVARSEAEIENLIAEIGRSGGGLCVMADPFTTKYVARIVRAAARERVPAAYAWSDLARAGGLRATQRAR